jgi:hypothetical protein
MPPDSEEILLNEWEQTKPRDRQTPEVRRFSAALDKVVGNGRVDLSQAVPTIEAPTPDDLIEKIKRQIKEN